MIEAQETFVDKPAAGALILPAIIGVVAMSHHPAIPQSSLSRPVHAIMIAVGMLTLFGFRRLFGSCSSASAQLGLLLYAAGIAAGILGGTINGFVVTNLADQGVTNSDLFQFAFAFNQALTAGGVIAMGAAYLTWAITLTRARRVWLAVTGALAGAVPIILLPTGLSNMHLHSAMLIYSVLLAWTLGVGIAITRGGLDLK